VHFSKAGSKASSGVIRGKSFLTHFQIYNNLNREK
jgi:hypothetical protein